MPPSLAYDLFGIASAHMVDPAAVRAKDIATELNDDEDSPYHGLVKYTGEVSKPGRSAKLGIALSSFVNAFKPLVADGSGVFPAYKVYELVNQTKAVTNFFKVLQNWYGDQWLTRDNVFMNASGVTGGIDFFKQHMVQYCAAKKSYSVATMRGAMELDPTNRISKKEAEKQGRRQMARTVKELLHARFIPAADDESKIEF